MTKKKKILWCITDPCYLLKGDDWYHCSSYDRTLKKKTGRNAWVGNTFYGDWTNHITGKGEIVDGHNEFCADSGMWCVCSPTEEMINKYGMEHFSRIAALFKASEDIRVEVDKSCPQWAVIRIYDNDELIFETDPY